MSQEKNNRQLKKENTGLKRKVDEMQDSHEKLSLSLSKHDHNHIHNVTISDLPPPEVIDSYPPDVRELILLRIKTDIHNDNKLIELEEKEQIIRHNESAGEIILKKRGQLFAFFGLLLLCGLAVYFGSIDALKIAATIVGVTIVGTIAAFIGVTKPKKEK